MSDSLSLDVDLARERSSLLRESACAVRSSWPDDPAAAQKAGEAYYGALGGAALGHEYAEDGEYWNKQVDEIAGVYVEHADMLDASFAQYEQTDEDGSDSFRADRT